jgi:hypothetical protein
VQEFLAARKPALKGTQGPAKFLGRLVPRFPFQVAQNQRRAVFLRQTVQFLVQGRAQFAPARLGRDARLPSIRRIVKRLGVRALPFCPRSGSQSDALGDPVEPTARRVPLGNGTGFANEDEESGLKSIFGIVWVRENATADAQDHRAMSSQDGFKGGLILSDNEALQELSVGQGPGGPRASQLADVPQDSASLFAPHVRLPG